MTKTSEIRRIPKELGVEIERVAKLNNEKFIEAAREIARMVRNSRNKKISREIKF